MSTLRELLNRAQWRDSLLHTLEIHVVHRGADGDRRVIPGARVVGVRSGGVELSPEVEGGDEVFVPYHRFLAIVDASGAELWSKDRGEAFDAGTSALTDTRAVVPAASSPKEITSDIEVILRRDDGLLVLDGSAGEGGGQILRTSLALSITTGKPFALENIRARRKKPGLMRQHLTSVKAAALVCGAAVHAGLSIRWFYVPDLVALLAARETLNHTLKLSMAADLLVWDDFGVEGLRDWQIGLLDRVVEARYRRDLPMVVTTNLSRKSLEDPSLARLNDRWSERRYVVTISGDSMRSTWRDRNPE